MSKNTASTETLAANVYGSGTTIGARQTAILRQLADFGSLRQYQIDNLNKQKTASAVAALRARGLVRARGLNLSLTVSGQKHAETLLAITLPLNSPVGLILSGVKEKKTEKKVAKKRR